MIGPRPKNEDRLICAPDLLLSLQQLENGTIEDVPHLVGERSTATRGGGMKGKLFLLYCSCYVPPSLLSFPHIEAYQCVLLILCVILSAIYFYIRSANY